jgi:hypothetical protein
MREILPLPSAKFVGEEAAQALEIRRLDLGRLLKLSESPSELLANVILCPTWFNPAYFQDSLLSPFSAHTANEALAHHPALLALAGDFPALVFGPLHPTAQAWDGPAAGPPTRTCFRAPSNAAPTDRTQAKLWVGGLYTSTRLDQTTSWEVYAGRSERIPTGQRGQWAPTCQQPLRIREIDSATTWVSFLREYPLLAHEALYPDWEAASNDVDAVHITLSGMMCIDGFSFTTSLGPTAPIYWNCETTLWLNWCFTDWRIVGERRP